MELIHKIGYHLAGDNKGLILYSFFQDRHSLHLKRAAVFSKNGTN